MSHFSEIKIQNSKKCPWDTESRTDFHLWGCSGAQLRVLVSCILRDKAGKHSGNKTGDRTAQEFQAHNKRPTGWAKGQLSTGGLYTQQPCKKGQTKCKSLANSNEVCRGDETWETPVKRRVELARQNEDAAQKPEVCGVTWRERKRDGAAKKSFTLYGFLLFFAFCHVWKNQKKYKKVVLK